MGKSKTISAAALVRHHQKAYAAMKRAHEALGQFNVPATCIIVPEFGVSHIFTVSQLDYLAAEYAEKKGLVPGSKSFLEFEERIAAYRDALNHLLELKEVWRATSGRERMEEAELDAHEAEEAAWELLLLEIKTGRDIAPIANYLAREPGIQELWRMRKAMKAIAGRGVR